MCYVCFWEFVIPTCGTFPGWHCRRRWAWLGGPLTYLTITNWFLLKNWHETCTICVFLKIWLGRPLIYLGHSQSISLEKLNIKHVPCMFLKIWCTHLWYSAWLTLTSMSMTLRPLTYLRPFSIDFSGKIGYKTCVIYVFGNFDKLAVALPLVVSLTSMGVSMTPNRVQTYFSVYNPAPRAGPENFIITYILKPSVLCSLRKFLPQIRWRPPPPLTNKMNNFLLCKFLNIFGFQLSLVIITWHSAHLYLQERYLQTYPEHSDGTGYQLIALRLPRLLILHLPRLSLGLGAGTRPHQIIIKVVFLWKNIL